MSISRTLLLGSITVAIISVLLTAIITATAGYFITQEEIEQQTQNHLVSIRDQQKDYLSSHLRDIDKQIITFSNSLTIRSATKDFLTAFKYDSRKEASQEMESELLSFYQTEFSHKYAERNVDVKRSANSLFNATGQKAKLFQYHFLANNPYNVGSKADLNSLENNSLYSRIHERYHPEIKSYLDAFHYYDILIIDSDTGDIIYSVVKEIDFATSLLTGPYRDSGLAKVFREAKQSSQAKTISFSPFSPYTPSYEDPAAFIASPILDDDGTTIAVLAFQMPINKINTIMTLNQQWSDKGLGQTGEAYLVAENYKAQSLSRSLIEQPELYLEQLKQSKTDTKIIDSIKRKSTNIGYQEIKTEGVKSALEGKSGFSIYNGYKEQKVLGAYTPLSYHGEAFALLAEMDEQEAYAFKDRLILSVIYNVLIISVLIISIVALIAWRFSRRLSRQLNYAVNIAKGVARGEKVDIPRNAKQDEVGELMRALNKMQTEVIGKLEVAADESKRITSAVEAASTNIMMADENLDIVYMNPAVLEMMQQAEADLKKELPHFKADDLLHKNIDIFHKKPEHQRRLLSKLQQTYKTKITIGPRHFDLTATPIYGDDNERLGTVVEWADKTAEVLIEQEVASLISAANLGDLSKRIDLSNQEGFFLTISDGLNALLEKLSGFVDNVAVLFEAMSQGDLRKRIENAYEGDFEIIRTNANNSLTKLNEVLAEIRSTSSTVKDSSNEVSQGADDLSRRTESQASSLEETAASMEELTETVKQTAENTTHSKELAIEARTKAEKGGEVVQGAIAAMTNIKEASSRINDIIGVIDEIAFQTNLLALNAAVEAARAGEQGRGFAVVAGEVRSLSQRSAAAAKEIKELIRDSVNKVESGANLVNQSGQMLAEIVHSAEEVSRMISDVNAAAIEQNSGIKQVNQALTEIDEMTQQNAALAEQTSATSRSMTEETNNMNRLISFFQLSQEAHQPQTTIPTLHEKAPVANSEPPRKAASDQVTKTWQKGAASFSSDDDWEDF